MKPIKLMLSSLLITAVFAAFGAARAEEYVAPTYLNLIKMLVRFGAVDMRDNDTLNSYAVVHECKLFQHFYKDEFRWHEFQKALRRSLQQEVETFPTSLRYTTQLQLGRYDFKEKLYRFTDKTSPKNANLFTLDASKEHDCDSPKHNLFPKTFKLVLDHPLNIAGLPFDEEEGKVIFKRMAANGNKDRIVYTIINMRVLYIAPLTRDIDTATGQKKGVYKQDNELTARLDARVASIDFFEDEAHTKLIYSYRP